MSDDVGYQITNTMGGSYFQPTDDINFQRDMKPDLITSFYERFTTLIWQV